LAGLGYLSVRYQSSRSDHGEVEIERNGKTHKQQWTHDPRKPTAG